MTISRSNLLDLAFVSAWERVAAEGGCDAVGSAEYHRVFREWNAAGRPEYETIAERDAAFGNPKAFGRQLGVESFIRRRANTMSVDHLVHPVRAVWPTLTGEQRLEVLRWLECCRHCGSLDPRCQCWNDK